MTPREVGALVYEDRLGHTHHREGPYLVHFWATWCAPCLEELPSLLRAARDEGVEDRVVALVVNPWPAVTPLFPQGIPDGVGLQPDNAMALALGVTAFPDTYRVDASGRAVRRLRRVVDWSAPAQRAWLRQLRD